MGLVDIVAHDGEDGGRNGECVANDADDST